MYCQLSHDKIFMARNAHDKKFCQIIQYTPLLQGDTFFFSNFCPKGMNLGGPSVPPVVPTPRLLRQLSSSAIFHFAISASTWNLFLSLFKCYGAFQFSSISQLTMSKKQCPILYSNLLYKLGQYFLDTQYIIVLIQDLFLSLVASSHKQVIRYI